MVRCNGSGKPIRHQKKEEQRKKRKQGSKEARISRGLNQRVDREYSFLDGVLLTSPNSYSTPSSESSSNDFLDFACLLFVDLTSGSFVTIILGFSDGIHGFFF
jgi:hypothetical protein